MCCNDTRILERTGYQISDRDKRAKDPQDRY